MEHTKIGVAAVLLLIVIGSMFIFMYLKKEEVSEPASTLIEEDVTPDAYASISRINGKHFYDGTTHTLVGEVLMPTPCDLLEWDVRIQESMPETAIIDFTVINEAETCVQVVTPQRFNVSFDASEDSVMRATLQGRPIDLNLVPAGPGEDPEDFELYIKG